ncbi:MAG: hypothetical protein ACE15E_21570 [Acidobacteriota bacterium]
MAKCYLTGVDLALTDAWVLDEGAARRALRDLRLKVATLERLLQELGQRDEVEAVDRESGSRFIRRDRRLVTVCVAKALSEGWPAITLFVPWPEWHERRPKPQSGTQTRETPVSSSKKQSPDGQTAYDDPANLAGANPDPSEKEG